MKIQAIHTQSFGNKSYSELENDKIKAGVISPNKVLGAMVGTFVGTGIIASTIASAKKVKRPILNGFEIGAAIGLLTAIGLHVYNSVKYLSRNNKD